MQSIRKFQNNYGVLGLIRLPLYPLVVLFKMPFILLQTLLACSVFWKYPNRPYPHFSPDVSMVGLFYWTAAINLKRFGRYGRSPYLGTGDYPLSKLFYFSDFAMQSYYKYGARLLLVGMFGWWINHVVWIPQVGFLWGAFVLILALFSTSFYAHLIGFQNYNVLGWVFFPIGVYGFITQQWGIAAFAWLGASFFSITTVFIGGLLSLGLMLLLRSLIPPLTLIPAGIVTLVPFYPMLNTGFGANGIYSVIKSIGLYQAKAKYVRRVSQSFTISDVYFMGLYGQFGLAVWLVTGQFPYLWLFGIMIYIMNGQFARFADIQSMYMMQFSLAVALTLDANNPWLLLPYWLVISPLPMILRETLVADSPDTFKIFEPCDMTSLFDGLSAFLQPVQADQRILILFESPQNTYEKLFDGYRNLIEPIIYVSTLMKIHVMPSWWAAFELNYEGAPEFWGRSVQDAERLSSQWQADYIIVYQINGPLDEQWQTAGYRVKAEFDWRPYTRYLANSKGEKFPPIWWLLSKNPAES